MARAPFPVNISTQIVYRVGKQYRGQKKAT